MNDFTHQLVDEDELPAGAPRAQAAASLPDAAQRFELADVTDRHDAPELLAAWRDMLGRGTSPEKLYQSPEFFRCIVESEHGTTRTHALYAVHRRSDGACVGIVPVRKSAQEVGFGVGPLRFGGRKLATLQVLGSVPLLDRSEPGLAAFVFDSLLRRHPECQVLSMQAVPAPQVDALDSLAGLTAKVFNGMRGCHTVPLPENFDAYLQKFSSKKRYNLTRQVRLLGAEAGEVQVCRIEAPEQVAGLIEAMRAILPAGHFAELANAARLERMARHGLMHSYVIRCGVQDVAVVLGTRSSDVWHVHNIAALPKYHALSAGTSAVHLALQDVITHFSFADADFGYGSPNQDFRATHVLKHRCTVLVCRARSATAALLAAHRVWQHAADGVVARIKEAQRRLKQRNIAARQAKAAAG
ncbi:GNAT family N-acetyltransferase [Massilia sp. Leaf139]|uniref:GNAT family N-acetyltransferase n=1 Tax=Massilia sp. Leaf139 TaxID=1736272 RepID=UPI0006FF30CA|nr:GNAT family N-acetyltransferase [Massilia sp. Leaf139]KQQ97282.1 hypothetical protein ASF77_04845 [Massilia sp. Leaf139]